MVTHIGLSLVLQKKRRFHETAQREDSVRDIRTLADVKKQTFLLPFTWKKKHICKILKKRILREYCNRIYRLILFTQEVIMIEI